MWEPEGGMQENEEKIEVRNLGSLIYRYLYWCRED
jgi:hypothetical protein